MIGEATSIGIGVHQDPDGDCLWAALWLWLYLEQQGKSVRYFTPNRISCLFSFLPEIERFQEHISQDYHPDLRISVDTSNLERSPFRVLSTTKPIINIDHHPTSAPRGTLLLINDQISSTCEIITHLLKENDTWIISSRIATFLLMGISTDTGHFQWWKDLATTYALTSFLLNAWADLPSVVTNIYRSNDFDGIRYVWYLLQQLHIEQWVIWVAFSQTELETHHLDEAKIETLLHIMTSIKHDWVFLLFKQYPNATTIPYLKCSFRTKNTSLNVGALAQQFGGWWHHAAAACRIETADMSGMQKNIISIVNDYISHIT
jgi:bifunctional oligoribonuclease and PAP phosphatase NrnA